MEPEELTETRAKRVVVYVGSGSGSLLVFALDRSTGKLTLSGETRAGECPSFVVFHPTRSFAYAIDEARSVVRSFAVDDNGELRELGCVDSGGAGPAYVSIDRSGSFALVANYAGGTIAVLPIGEGGALEAATQIVEAGKNPHSIAADFGNARVSVPVLGDDAVLQYAFDARRGRLEAATVARTALPVGTGPRHIDFHPTLPVAYVVHEHSSELTAYSVGADGALTPRVTCSTLPAGADHTGNTGSDVHVAPSGRFVYASNRGHDSITAFALDEAGLPSFSSNAKTLGSTPRNFSLIDHGARLLVANLRSDSVTTFAVDPMLGTLTPLYTTEGIPAPFWIGAPPGADASRARRAA